jgi:hypothetical protein
VAVGADADGAVQPDSGARLDAGDLRAAVEDGGELAGGVADLAGQHGVPGRLAGPGSARAVLTRWLTSKGTMVAAAPGMRLTTRAIRSAVWSCSSRPASGG